MQLLGSGTNADGKLSSSQPQVMELPGPEDPIGAGSEGFKKLVAAINWFHTQLNLILLRRYSSIH